MTYTTLYDAIFSIFAQTDWTANNIKTFPENFSGEAGDEFIRVNVLASQPGVNLNSVAGQVIIDIFTKINQGPKRAGQIADTLNTFLRGKSIQVAGNRLQFFGSTLVPVLQQDSLFRSRYSIQFQLYGV